MQLIISDNKFNTIEQVKQFLEGVMLLKFEGVYHIHAMDEATEWEMVASVERIAKNYLAPIQYYTAL